MDRFGDIRLTKSIKDEKSFADTIKGIMISNFHDDVYVGSFIDNEGFHVDTASGFPLIFFVGKGFSLTFTRNMKGQISCLAMKYDPLQANVKKLDKMVSEIMEFTGGKFYGRDI